MLFDEPEYYSLATQRQKEFIDDIARALKLESPSSSIRLKTEASDWIDAHLKEYQAGANARRREERVRRAVSLHEQGKDIPEIAAEMRIKEVTIRKYLSEGVSG